MSFSQIPDTLRVPGVRVEVDPSIATEGVGVFPFRALIIGQRTAAGTVAAGVVRRTTSVNQAREEHGPGSLTHLMVKAWLEQNTSVALDVVSLEDAGGGVAATGDSTVSGAISTPGTVFVYIAGKRLTVLASVDPTTTAAAVVAAVNADTDLPVTAGNVGPVITLTAKNKGEASNNIDVRFNHLVGEDFPGTLAFSATSPFFMTGGTVNSVLTAAFTAIAGTRYDVIAHPYVDTANLNLMQNEMIARADALQGEPGVAFAGVSDSHSNLVGIGDARNDEFQCIVGTEQFPGWGPIRGCAVAAQAARFLQEDPVRPVTGRQLLVGFAPATADKFTPQERDLLLHDGISTVRYDSSDRATVERLITTYQETSGGSDDEAYLDVQTMFGLSFVRRSYVAHFSSQFPNHKVADNGTPTPPGGSHLRPRRPYPSKSDRKRRAR